MRTTQLILVEGIPGSGKSTTCQFLQRQLEREGNATQWWYEEDKDHPLYTFDDLASMQAVVDDLNAGRYQEVIDAAIAKWQQFVDDLASGKRVAILESCLLGYLTWTLFPFDAPEATILDYQSQVEQIVEPVAPCLIYYYQDDPTTVLRRVSANRGEDWARGFVERVEKSAYGKRNGMSGFAGLVRYWSDYRTFADRIFDRLAFPKLRIENSGGDWPVYHQRILDFLDVPSDAKSEVSEAYLQRFVGTYTYRDGDVDHECEIQFEHGTLVAIDVPHLWQRNPLIATSANTFLAESFPTTLVFDVDASSAIGGFTIRGRDRLDGTVSRSLLRKG